MELIEYRTMYELEEHHWWFQSRLMMTEGWLEEYILPAFGSRKPDLLDLGCGTGLFMQRRGVDCRAFGLDISPQALTYCRSRDLHRVALADAVCLPLPDASFDVVTAFDLIEHLPDDHAFVREVWRVLRPGGFLMATVPAHPLLWTAHDLSLHHQRRYRRETFEALFAPTQWETVRMTAGFTLVFPAAGLIRLARHLLHDHSQPKSDTHRTQEWLNRLLIGMHRFEARWLRHHDLPVGISLMTLRRKRAYCSSDN